LIRTFQISSPATPERAELKPQDGRRTAPISGNDALAGELGAASE
jgi:hypothetical protein